MSHEVKNYEYLRGVIPPQGLFSPFFTFLRAISVSARLDFPSPPLSAPGSPRMYPSSISIIRHIKGKPNPIIAN